MSYANEMREAEHWILRLLIVKLKGRRGGRKILHDVYADMVNTRDHFANPEAPGHASWAEVRRIEAEAALGLFAD